MVQGDPEPAVGGYSQFAQVGGQGHARSRDQVTVCPCGDVVVAVCGAAREGAMVCVSEAAGALVLRVTGRMGAWRQLGSARTDRRWRALRGCTRPCCGFDAEGHAGSGPEAE